MRSTSANSGKSVTGKKQRVSETLRKYPDREPEGKVSGAEMGYIIERGTIEKNWFIFLPQERVRTCSKKTGIDADERRKLQDLDRRRINVKTLEFGSHL